MCQSGWVKFRVSVRDRLRGDKGGAKYCQEFKMAAKVLKKALKGPQP